MKRRIILATITGIVYCCIFVAVSSYDLHISAYLTAREVSAIIIAGARIGPLPAFFAPAWCLKALERGQKYKFLYRLVQIGLCISCGWALAHSETVSPVEIIYIAAASVLFYGLLQILPLPEDTARGRKLLWLCVMITAGSFLTVQFMKYLWGRPRYIAIMNEGADFKEWFKIAGFAIRKDYYRSFPSGHTVSAAAIFFLTFLPDLFPNLPQRSWIWWTASFLFTVGVAFSRVMGGMHFVTDVMAGFAVYMLWYLVLVFRFQMKEEKDKKRAEEGV